MLEPSSVCTGPVQAFPCGAAAVKALASAEQRCPPTWTLSAPRSRVFSGKVTQSMTLQRTRLCTCVWGCAFTSAVLWDCGGREQPAALRELIQILQGWSWQLLSAAGPARLRAEADGCLCSLHPNAPFLLLTQLPGPTVILEK